jgi:3'-5' exoribonuclease
MGYFSKIAKGDTISGVFLVKKCERKTGSNGVFFDMILSDGTTDIDAKAWNQPIELEIYDCPSFVYASGEITEFKERLQFKVITHKEVIDLNESEKRALVTVAPEPLDSLKEELNVFISKIEISLLRELIIYIIKKVGYSSFIESPAASSNHHNYMHGLLYHTVSMLRISDSIIGFKNLNRDLMYTGIVLHDIAKPLEFEQKLGIVSKYSKEGNLLGHISLVYGWTVEFANKREDLLVTEKDREYLILLQHILLSHHGKLEWGSPVVPKTPEAIAIHFIDNLDAKTHSAEQALRNIGPGETSGYNNSNSTYLYNNTLKGGEIDELPI